MRVKTVERNLNKLWWAFGGGGSVMKQPGFGRGNLRLPSRESLLKNGKK
jgi:hypothetical protein